MFCEECGTKLAESAKFCDNCGVHIDALQLATKSGAAVELDLPKPPVPNVSNSIVFGARPVEQPRVPQAVPNQPALQPSQKASTINLKTATTVAMICVGIQAILSTLLFVFPDWQSELFRLNSGNGLASLLRIHNIALWGSLTFFLFVLYSKQLKK
jgi:hypothetical protein